MNTKHLVDNSHLTVNEDFEGCAG